MAPWSPRSVDEAEAAQGMGRCVLLTRVPVCLFAALRSPGLLTWVPAVATARHWEAAVIWVSGSVVLVSKCDPFMFLKLALLP